MNTKTKIVSLAVLSAGTACAMPAKQEIADTRPLVAELMAPAIADLKTKTKTPAEVADVSVGFAESAKSEAARYLFLRGAIGYYVRSGEFGKAADAVDALKAKVKDVPPSEVADIISAALGRENARKAPRLQSQLALAQAQAKAAKDVRRLAATLKQVKTDAVICQYAEALALTGNWKQALEELSKLPGVLVSTTGFTSRELFEIRERRKEGHERDFLTVGSMGHASMIALGMAEALPDRRIWCLDGDGAVMMHMGALPIIGKRSPARLIHVVINNGAHETVGGMPVCSGALNLLKAAEAAGYARIASADSEETLEAVLKEITDIETFGPVFLEIRCACGARSDLGRPTTTPQENRDALMHFVTKS